ncbi:MAG: DUF177 domain-containing protein [Desulfovibrio sp.]|jgi:uncharacterized protein|nr:DUF177 domain-containing protein [Desulfovibrio sp.]
MDGGWTGLQSIPPEGKTFIFDNPAVWREPMEEFSIVCLVLEPLRAEIFVLPQNDGVLFQGRLTGRVALPCDRCADDAVVDLDYEFNEFEPYPALVPRGPAAATERRTPEKHGLGGGRRIDYAQDETCEDMQVIRAAPYGRDIEINPAALAWEEFVLALPAKPLCRNDCRGLCPVCGKNNNRESCSCANEGADPRLDVLRGIKVGKEGGKPARKRNGRSAK